MKYYLNIFSERAAFDLKSYEPCMVAVFGAKQKLRAWSNAIGKAFLDPFGVGQHATITTSAGTKGNVLRNIQDQLPGVTVLTACNAADRCASTRQVKQFST